MSRVIGVMGGLGPEGTVHYYRKLTERFASVPLERGRPGILIDHVWIDRFSALLRAEAEPEIQTLLLGSLERLHHGGADLALIAAVTPHRFLPRLRAASPLPIVDIVSATRDDVLAAGHRAVGLLGTRVTVTQRFFRSGLEEAGVEVAIPGEDDIEYLNNLIFGPLASGQKTPAMREELSAVVRRMAASAKLDALVVACTDLMDLLEPSLPLLDPIDSHVRVAAERLLEPGAAKPRQRSD
ncbi:MAG TPA: amino acid racemase [Anaeromyxobacteraceae bacterium]|nr:amino acid racemase [Anaeromyxobacteraceae bacterium]